MSYRGTGYANCVYSGTGGLNVRYSPDVNATKAFTIQPYEISNYQHLQINYYDGYWIGWNESGYGQVYSVSGSGNADGTGYANYWEVTEWNKEGTEGGGENTCRVMYLMVEYSDYYNDNLYVTSSDIRVPKGSRITLLSAPYGDNPISISSSNFNITLNKNDGSGITDKTTCTKTTITKYTKFTGWVKASGSTNHSNVFARPTYRIDPDVPYNINIENDIYLFPVFSDTEGVSSSSSYNFEPTKNYKNWAKYGYEQCILHYTNKAGSTKSVSSNQTISYAFSGWSESSNGPVLSQYTGAQNLYAIWSTTSYSVAERAIVTIPNHSNPGNDTNIFTVQFNASGGNNVNSMQCGTRSYTFNRWLLSDGSAFGYNSGDSYAMPSTSVSIKESWSESISNNVIYLPSATKNNSNSHLYAITLKYGNGQSDETKNMYRYHTSYAFNSWYKDGGLSQYAGGSGSAYTVTGNQTLFAKWNETTIEGEAIPSPSWGDTVENDVVTTLNYNYNSISEPKTSHRTVKHTFDGWYNGSTRVNTSPYVPTSNTTLTAKWADTSRYDAIDLNDISRPDTPGTRYNITYNGNGGTPSRDTEEVTIGRKQYTFDGWFIGNTKYSSTYTPTALHNELTARWTETPVDQKATLPNASRSPVGGDKAYVTLIPNGGTVDSELNLVTANGTTYEFAGWYDSASCTNHIGNKGDQYTPSGSNTYIELFAKWNSTVADGMVDLPIPTRTDVTEYTVTLDAGDGVFSNNTHTQTQVANTKTDYTFLGWFTDSGRKVPNPYSPPLNTTTYLTAKWEGKGSVNTPITLTTPAYRVESNMAINLYKGVSTSEKPTVKNAKKTVMRKFNGWFLDGIRIDSASNKYMPSKSGITINAQWSKDTCAGIGIDDISRPAIKDARNIILNTNGGSAIADGVNLTALQEIYYTFLGWYSARTGGDPMVDKEGFYYPDPNSSATSINMYAHWSTVTTNTKIDLPASTKFGYTLLGWAPDGSKTPVENPYMPPRNGITLYAIWDFNGKVLVGGKKCIIVVGKNGKWNKVWPHIFRNGKFRPTKL